MHKHNCRGTIFFTLSQRNTGLAESHRVLSEVQKEIKVVALNKTETQCTYHCFPPEFVCGGGVHTLGMRQPKQSLPSGIWQTTLAQGGTLDVSARKLKKLCLILKARLGVFWHIWYANGLITSLNYTIITALTRHLPFCSIPAGQTRAVCARGVLFGAFDPCALLCYI